MCSRWLLLSILGSVQPKLDALGSYRLPRCITRRAWICTVVTTWRHTYATSVVRQLYMACFRLEVLRFRRAKSLISLTLLRFQPWRWRQYDPPERWNRRLRLVIAQDDHSVERLYAWGTAVKNSFLYEMCLLRAVHALDCAVTVISCLAY
jgi:hypothetical protein